MTKGLQRNIFWNLVHEILGQITRFSNCQIPSSQIFPIFTFCGIIRATFFIMGTYQSASPSATGAKGLRIIFSLEKTEWRIILPHIMPHSLLRNIPHLTFTSPLLSEQKNASSVGRSKLFPLLPIIEPTEGFGLKPNNFS